MVAPGKSALETAGGIVYKKSVFSKDEYQKIHQELLGCLKHLKDEDVTSIANKRRGTALNLENPIIHILQQGSLHRLVQRLAGPQFELSSDLPVEVRVYDRPGAGMAWHSDDVLYDPPQVEVVWTLQNDSDCSTMWKTTSNARSSHNNNNNNKETEDATTTITKVETEPNSAILLLAGGPLHCVTHLKRGSRIIVKCVFIQRDAVLKSGGDQTHQQFTTIKASHKKTKKRSHKKR